ncbi:MAG: response regulator [Candidatus Omnitrophica bacterium]|nr:response regulator [Candidatus Omnitrophota bacterium]MBU4334068.1 response regulator [Candidatus Omnitrophota bacterium]
MTNKSKKILIVDDELGIRESLNLILSDHYDLILTESGTQALEVIDNCVDLGLVLMDIKMPQVNGLEVLATIKEKRPDLKVIIITGYKSIETASEASSLGASGYIVKPFKSDEILEKVKNNFE